jgi:Putative Zn-dependent protease, contains TPR repeats
VKASLPPRRLIPRWRRTSATLNLPEATYSVGKRSNLVALDTDRFERVLEEWKESPTTGLLGDLLSFSVDPSLAPAVIEVAEKALAEGFHLSPAQRLIVLSLTGEESERLVIPGALGTGVCNPAIQRQVAEIRRILSVNYANPLVLLDLAQFQVASGQAKRAERTVLSALSLSPYNRVIIRTLARLYVHMSKPDKAHALIKGHVLTPTDPWLMASEVSLADLSGSSSRFASKGFRFVRDKAASSADLTELAGALGVSELKAGSVGRARDMFRLALTNPNDNVIAQAVTHQSSLGFHLDQPVLREAISTAQEAQLLIAWNSLRVDVAEQNALMWHDEEPFSSRPLQFLTALYAVQKRYTEAENLALRGLIADPDELALLANYAYALASSGKLDAADRVLQKMLSVGHGRYDAIALATKGLVALKRGQLALGDALYSEAMGAFRSRKEFSFEALCQAYYARAAQDVGHPEAHEILLRAEALYQKHGTSDAAIVLRQLDPSLEAPKEEEATRRLNQWVFDKKTDSLISRPGVSRPGAPPLIVKE